MSELIPEGKYRARATRGDFGESAQKKTPFVRVAFEILDEGPAKGRQLSWNGYFSGDAQSRTIDSLRYCGCTFPDNDVMNLDGLTSGEVQIVVEHEDYEDQEGNPKTAVKVAWVNAIAGAVRETERMADTSAAQFKSRMKASIVLAKRGGGSSAAAPTGNGSSRLPPATNQLPEEDIPF